MKLTLRIMHMIPIPTLKLPWLGHTHIHKFVMATIACGVSHEDTKHTDKM
jgi:hypothetical protein